MVLLGRKYQRSPQEDLREALLARRSPRTSLKLVTRDKGMSRREQQGSKRLQWKRPARRKDCFDLILMNPGVLDVARCRQLLEVVQSHFDTDASREFQRWLGNLDTPLGEQAYARLSNWFLTDEEHSPLAEAARELWRDLFCAIPDRRLTDPNRDYKILRERLRLWWSKQWDCQNR